MIKERQQRQVHARCNSVPSDYRHSKGWSSPFSSRAVKKNATHAVVQVLGQRVDEDDLPGGRSAVQADGGVEVVVPEHGASQQSDQQSHDQHREQRDQPAEDRHARGAGQVPDVPAT